MKKVLNVFIMVLLFQVLMATNVLAEENLDNTLISAGYYADTLKELTAKEKAQIYNGVKCGKTEISSCVMEVDNLEEIEAFCAMSDAELIEAGMSKSDIKETKNSLDAYYKMNNVEIKNKYGDCSDLEIKLVKRAMDKGKHNKGKYNKKGGEVFASGSIASSSLSYTQAKTDLSTKTRPCYDMTISYNWSKVYVVNTKQDKILTAWGGNLNATNISSRADYYESDWSGWNSIYCRSSFSKKQTPNAAIEFTCDQAKNGYKNKCGCVQFRLSQSAYLKSYAKRLNSKLVSQYCHRKLSGNASLSLSVTGASVSFSVGSGWDYTSQRESAICY